MTPDTPQDPSQGKADEPTPDEATSSKKKAAASKEKAPEGGAKAEAAQAKRKRTPKKAKEAEGTAAEKTGVDKAAAEAAPSEKKPAKPRQRRTKPADKEKAATAAKPAPAPTRRRSRRREGEPAVLVSAQAKYVRTSARKARLVCDHIRGKSVSEARTILAFTPRSVAKDWIKVLDSAVANAEHNHELVGDDLRIHAVYADEGPTLKRFRPRAMGRATRIRKRTAHLTITLTPKES